MHLPLLQLSTRIAYRLWPDLYRRRLRSWAQRRGLARPVFFLSFDCDTDRDAAVAVALQQRLHQAGIAAAWAVPGALLEDHWDQYGQLPALGGQFVNHGYRRHAATDPVTGKAVTTFGYAGVDDAVWQDDIRQGHEAITRLIGTSPSIFRTPHFGEFADGSRLSRLYTFLRGLGYQVSSSTLPVAGMIGGPIYDAGGDLLEFPLSGCFDRPGQLIDSWGFYGAPDAHGGARLVQALDQWLVAMQSGQPLVMNIYFDPADIAGEAAVLDRLCAFAPYARLPFSAASLQFLMNGGTEPA